jgi:hypothetical protein
VSVYLLIKIINSTQAKTIAKAIAQKFLIELLLKKRLKYLLSCYFIIVLLTIGLKNAVILKHYLLRANKKHWFSFRMSISQRSSEISESSEM